ncbi:hypothetical protein [Pararhodobacter sp. CCB-MM2]|uniref:hypothetical protein n=1 Tax=Pararhodobacter sp. CCB-MM2 TaxID=1786003 RepID=UPI00082C7F43|nr:hypothetical protein [Pararhodobacter sp. CCB-MM2]MCA2013150.1 hypothetical protein [Cereibacter sphaeroides]
MADTKTRSHVPGAIARALLVVFMAIFPAMAIPSTAPDIAQSMILLALFAGGIVFAEYSSDYPGLIEFRFAAPFNRTRFALVAVLALMMSLLQRNGVEPGLLGGLTASAAAACGQLLDFAFSPVRLLIAALPDSVSPEHIVQVRDGAALALVLAVTTVLGFVTAIRLNAWPMGSGPFNVWINLPTFDPTAGNDVVQRLQRHARINIALGIILPFLLPAAVLASELLMKPLTLLSPMGFVWGIVLWAYIPASLVMRGTAMARVARMIRASRRRFADSEGNAFAAA